MAAITRTSTLRAVSDPTRWTSWFCRTRRQLGLRRQRHVADLVQKQSAAVGVLEQARLVLGGAGEGALHVAEQLAFKQRFDHRRAVQHHVAARAAGLSRCSARATRSLPVPVSPVISTAR